MFKQLPKPALHARHFGARSLYVLTDQALYESCGVRVAFTGRQGGVSRVPYEGLNLGTHVGDDVAAVWENRHILLESLDASSVELIVPNQVHGNAVAVVASSEREDIQKARDIAEDAADAVVVQAANVAALLCFADCVPVIVVSPTGRFAVIHAGWRGVINGVAHKAVRQLEQLDKKAGSGITSASYNAYLGPHIRCECFQTGKEVMSQFVERYGDVCVAGNDCVNMAAALSVNLQEAGLVPERIADAGICTKCNPDLFYSYRAEHGICGRHGAIAFLKEEA